jgi:NTP pyrophosphatase (non-canonical NTP hydrolase)
MNAFNRLTPAEAERLALLAEECAEVIQMVGKILRHGFESTHPAGGPTNRQSLEKELGDVQAAVDLMVIADDVSSHTIEQHCLDKHRAVQQYLHHQKGIK